MYLHIHMYRFKGRQTYKTADTSTMYGNAAYVEATDDPGKDVLGKEQVMINLP